MGAPIIDVDENLRLLGTAHVATASVEAVRKISKDGSQILSP